MVGGISACTMVAATTKARGPLASTFLVKAAGSTLRMAARSAEAVSHSAASTEDLSRPTSNMAPSSTMATPSLSLMGERRPSRCVCRSRVVSVSSGWMIDGAQSSRHFSPA